MIFVIYAAIELYCIKLRGVTGILSNPININKLEISQDDALQQFYLSALNTPASVDKQLLDFGCIKYKTCSIIEGFS